ncbi:MAG: hypothetical protein K1X35_04100 [Caulobacteraceae bacterium]|nr:hypothetical protein [Caulobacteraceae bacterium]
MFSATHASLEGFRIIGRRPISMIVWTIVYTLLSFGFIAGVCYFLGSTFIGEIIRHHDDPTWARDLDIDNWQDAWRYFGGLFQVIALLIPATLLLGAVQMSAVFRTVLRPKERGFAYLKLGADELRQVGLMIVLLLLFAVVLCGGVLGLIFGLKAAGLEEGMSALLAVLGGVLLVVLAVWLSIRLSLAAPATFARKRLTVFGAWGLTRGHFWGLLGMYILSAIFTIIVTVVIDMIARAVGGAMGFSMASLIDGDQLAIDFANFTWDQAWTLFGYGGLAYVMLSMLGNTFQLALTYGPQAAAYRDLSGGSAPAPEAAAAAPPADHGDGHGGDGHGGHGGEAALAAAAVAGGAAAVAASHAHAEDHGHAAPAADHGHADHGHAADHGHGDHGHGDHGHAAADHGHGDHGHAAADHGHADHGHADHAHAAADHGHGDHHAAADHGHADHGHGAADHAPAADHGHADHGHEDHGHAAAADHGHGDHGHGDHGHGDHGHGDHGHADQGHADHGASAHPADPHDHGGHH